MFLPNGVAFLSEARISTKRIQDFMLLNELGKNKESASLGGVTTYTFCSLTTLLRILFTQFYLYRMENRFKVSYPILRLVKLGSSSPFHTANSISSNKNYMVKL